MKPTLKVTSDFTAEFNRIIKKFKSDEVLIGIPESAAARQPGPDASPAEPINNATILAMANFGSAANNIPAWPLMAIGIRNAKNEIAEQYKQAAINALKRGFSALTVFYERAGIIASNSIKKTINDQEDAPSLSPVTLAQRKARGFKGDKRLVVTGQTRNAITYVVKGGE